MISVSVHLSFLPVIHPSTLCTSLSPLCINGKSFSKTQFYFYSCLAPLGTKRESRGSRLLQEPCQLNSFSRRIHFLCEFNLHATALLLIYHIYCVFVFICDQFICSLQTDPPLPLMGNFDKDRSDHLWDYWSSIYSEDFICSEEF